MTATSPVTRQKLQTTIRLATPQDVPSICHLGATTFSSTFGHSLPASDLEAYLASAYSVSAITADLSNPAITTYVAVPSSSTDPSDTSILGFAQLSLSAPEPCVSGPIPIEFLRFYVSSDFHGQGIGGKLWRASEEAAKEKGCETMWLGVWEENVLAQGVYRGYGFEKVGEHDFVMGSCVQTDWIMEKSLK